jgi:hypothetical protein
MRLTGLWCVAGGAGLVVLFGSQGTCLGDACNSRGLPGGQPGEQGLGLATVVCLVVAAVGLFRAAGRRDPVRKAAVASALCALGAAFFGVAAAVTAARTGGETWLMPVFVFPTLLLTVAAMIVVAAVVLRARLVPRWIAVTMILAASLLPLYQPQTPGNFIPALLGATWVVLGAHLVLFAGVTENQGAPSAAWVTPGPWPSAHRTRVG